MNNLQIYKEDYDIGSIVICNFPYWDIKNELSTLFVFSEKKNDFVPIQKEEITGLIISRMRDYPIVPEEYINFVVENFKNLEYISLGCYNYNSLDFLCEFKSLKSISFSGNVNSTFDFDKINRLISLSIKIQKNVRGIAKLASLKYLYIDFNDLKNAIDFSKLISLKVLSTIRMSEENLSNILHSRILDKIKSFEINKMKKLYDISFLQNNKSIEELYISFCPQLKKLDALGTLLNLKILKLEGLKTIESINFLLRLEHIKRFKIIGNTKILDNHIKDVFSDKKFDEFWIPVRKGYDITIHDLI